MFSIWFHIRTVFYNLMTGKRRTVFSLISLSAALALCVFVLLYARFESSWDHHFKDYKRIYRFSSVILVGKSQSIVSLAPLPLRNLLQDQDEVDAATRIFNPGKGLVKTNGKYGFENKFFLSDSNIVDVFSIKFHPDDLIPLPDSNSVAISASAAERYFKDENPRGKTLTFNNTEFVVSSVFNDLPVNTHFHPEFIGSISILPQITNQHSSQQETKESWMRIQCYTYVKLKPGVDAEQFSKKVNELKDEESAEELTEIKQYTNDTGDNVAVDFFAEPITDIHMLSKAEFPIEKGIKFAYLAIFVSLASLILVFAGINFVYTTEATSPSRTSELQALLTMGLSRFQLFRRLKIEIIVQSILAAFLALVIVELLISIANNIWGLRLGLWEADYHSTGVILFVCAISVAAGILPSYRFVYGYPLADALRSRPVKRHFGFKALILFAQVTLFSFLLFVIGGMWTTLTKLGNIFPGYDTQRVMVIERSDLLDNHWTGFKASIEKIAGVEKTATAKSLPGTQHNSMSFKVGNSQTNPMVMLTINEVSADYFDVMGIVLKNGVFIGNSPSDSLAVMLNETAVNKYGIIKPIGERIEVENPKDHVFDVVVKGVIGDYWYDDFTSHINPMLIALCPSDKVKNYIIIRTNEDFDRHSAGQIEEAWHRFLPGIPMEMNPLSHYTAKQFDDDFRMLRIGIILLVVSFYVLITGLFAFADSQFEINIYKLSVKQLCGASFTSAVAQLIAGLIPVILPGMALSLVVSASIIKTFQDIFSVQVGFPWFVIIIGALIIISLSIAVFALSCSALLRRKRPIYRLVG